MIKKKVNYVLGRLTKKVIYFRVCLIQRNVNENENENGVDSQDPHMSEF